MLVINANPSPVGTQANKRFYSSSSVALSHHTQCGKATKKSHTQVVDENIHRRRTNRSDSNSQTESNIWTAVKQYCELKMRYKSSEPYDVSVLKEIMAANGQNGATTVGLPNKTASTTASNGSSNNISNNNKDNNNRNKWKKFTKAAFKRSTSTDSAKSVVSPVANSLDNNNTGDHRENILNTKETNGLTNVSEVLQSLDSKELSFIQLVALKSLELTAPASDILLRNRSKNWVQLSGHEGSFAPAAPGTIWKKRSPDDTEVKAYRGLMNDLVMRDFVPKFYNDIEYQGEHFIEMQDLLHDFTNPSIMDIKMGTRTFLESEVKNDKLRPDLYEKMIKLDSNAATSEENQLKAITKLRYMTFRENLSSSSSLGFRIEGFKAQGKTPSKDVKFVKTSDDVKRVFKEFFSQSDLMQQLVEKLHQLKTNFIQSNFFKTHEIIGSSLLIIYDKTRIGVWMIDFAKTVPLPDGVITDHLSPWQFGNHEDGYLFGLSNLIRLLEEVHNEE